MADENKFIWHCQRMGGTDQVMLSTMDELRHLRELDPKLWGALSCPAAGLEFDKRTLSLLDTDGDNRIRMPEILDAVDWLCERVNDTATIPDEPTEMALTAIDTTNSAGRRLRTTAQTILSHLGALNKSISPDQVKNAAETAANQSFNGDGILPPLDIMDADVKEFVQAGLSVVGGAKDAGGAAGLNKELAANFVQELKVWQTWRGELAKAPHPVQNTERAWALYTELKPRIDDFFLRCDLSAFAPKANAPLNAEERMAEVADKPEIDISVLSALPLAHVESSADLPLKTGLNPVWSAKVQEFGTLIAPLLNRKEKLSKADWHKIEEALSPYGNTLNSRPAVTVYEAGDFAPATNAAEALDAFGDTGVRKLLAPKTLQKFNALCDKDLANAAASEDIAELEKLVLYYCNIHRLLMNFVSFFDFYTLRPNVTFRAGTLFIDGRSCQLCVPVDDVTKHSNMASRSQLCLLYCECSRHAADGTVTDTRNIMAVLTAGSDDVLVEGRNGVFVDNTGADWDAKLLKIVHNPISFNQAIWSPYKRISAMIGETVAKFAANKSAESLAAAQKGLSNLTQAKPAPVPFDISKGVGIFAAVGIALGAIGTAIGSIAQALFSLAWWQFPLLIAGIFVIISGPSVFLAWLKFRKRTFGPVLEASGWAVNSQLPINLKLGGALTSVPKVPDNIERQSLIDPFRDEKNPHRGLWISLAILIVAIIFGGWLYGSGKLDGVIATISKTINPDADKQAAKKGNEDTKKSKAKDNKKAAKGKDDQGNSEKAAKSDDTKDQANGKDEQSDKDATAKADDKGKDAKDPAKTSAKEQTNSKDDKADTKTDNKDQAKGKDDKPDAKDSAKDQANSKDDKADAKTDSKDQAKGKGDKNAAKTEGKDQAKSEKAAKSKGKDDQADKAESKANSKDQSKRGKSEDKEDSKTSR